MSRILRTLALLSTVLTAVVLAACGGDDGADAGSATAADTASSATWPVTIEHKFGTTTIDAEPKRVVTAGYTELDTVLALGVTPVGTRAFLGGYDWRQRPWAKADKTPAIIGDEELNFEAIAAERPDLIVAVNTGMTRSDYRKLSQIAPTVAQTADFIDFGMPWRDQTELIGRALGRSEQAEQVIADVDAKFAAAREAHPEFGKATAILAYGGPDGYGAYATGDTRSRFLTDLGFTIPKAIDKLAGDQFYAQFSQERFRLLDEDAVVMYGPEKTIKANPVFGRLDAVREDRIVYLDLGDQIAGALGFSSPLSLPYLVDEIVPKLAAAVDGDPATPVAQPE